MLKVETVGHFGDPTRPVISSTYHVEGLSLAPRDWVPIKQFADREGPVNPARTPAVAAGGLALQKELCPRMQRFQLQLRLCLIAKHIPNLIAKWLARTFLLFK